MLREQHKSTTNYREVGEGVPGTEPCLGLGEGLVASPAAPPGAAGAVSPRFTITSCFSKAVCLLVYLFFPQEGRERGMTR